LRLLAIFPICLVGAPFAHQGVPVDDFALTIVITKTDFNTNDMHSRTDAFIEEEIIARLSTE